MTDAQMIKWGLAFGMVNVVLTILGMWKLGELIAGII